MPLPVSRYQRPEWARGAMPALAQSRSSALCVPESSPRERNRARRAATRRSAACADSALRNLAGSSAGPRMTKSLNMTSRRNRPWPEATKASSESRSWTSSASTSPRRPSARAWPVPTATTRTAIPVRAVKRGSRKSSSPESRVEVVEARVMLRAGACTACALLCACARASSTAPGSATSARASASSVTSAPARAIFTARLRRAENCGRPRCGVLQRTPARESVRAICRPA